MAQFERSAGRHLWLVLMVAAFGSSCSQGSAKRDVGTGVFDAPFEPEAGDALSDGTPDGTSDGGSDELPNDAAPGDTFPIETAPNDATPNDTPPADATPNDAPPIDVPPNDATPGDATPDEATAGDAAPGDASPTSGVPLFVAVGYGFRRDVSCDGHTWPFDEVLDPNGGDDATLARGLAYGNGLFVASVGGGGMTGKIFTSDDGVTWVERVAAGTYNGFSQVAYGNGYFVAGGGNVSIRSRKGVDGWGELSSMGGGGILRHMTFGGGHFVAVGGSRIMVSTEAISWTPPRSGTCGDPVDVVYGQGRFLAVDSNGVTCLSTDEGDTWTNGTVGGGNIRGILWTGAGFLVTAADRSYRSPDGAVWTSTPGGGPQLPTLDARGTYVGSGFMWSADGASWKAAPSQASAGNRGIVRIVYGLGRPSSVCPRS